MLACERGRRRGNLPSWRGERQRATMPDGASHCCSQVASCGLKRSVGPLLPGQGVRQAWGALKAGSAFFAADADTTRLPAPFLRLCMPLLRIPAAPSVPTVPCLLRSLCLPGGHQPGQHQDGAEDVGASLE